VTVPVLWGTLRNVTTYRGGVSITVDLPADLIEKLQPILRDVGTAGLDIRLGRAGWDTYSAESFVMYFVNGSGRGIQWGAGTTPDDLVMAMDTIQDEVVEARWAVGLGVSWPVCAGHEHPLRPRLVEGRAVWQCPETNQVVAPIGGLGSASERTG